LALSVRLYGANSSWAGQFQAFEVTASSDVLSAVKGAASVLPPQRWVGHRVAVAILFLELVYGTAVGMGVEAGEVVSVVSAESC